MATRRKIHEAIGALAAAGALSGCALSAGDRDRHLTLSAPPAPPNLPAPVQAPARLPSPPVQGVVVAALPPPTPPPPPPPAPPPAPPAIAAPVAVAQPVVAVPLPGTPSAVAPVIDPLPLTSVVRFGSDAFLPEPGSDALLRAHAEQLKADPRRRLLLKGHGDGRGTVHYNQALAAKRADTVARALRAYGADAWQLTLIAIGDDSDPDGPDVRRVVLIYR
jgi:outer membrane protein OmpA-like peptidoglycan-associated protein